jgi:predicted metal-dependent enzyme (double-stranded beta helix superfamily)
MTVQPVTFSPRIVSTIHNHEMWGIVAVLKEPEKNTFWKRTNDLEFNNKIESVGEVTL